MSNPPIVVCTINGRCLPVLEASAKLYSPEAELHVHWVEPKSWGTNHNEVLPAIFENNDAVILANDDIVLNPNSLKLLMADVAELKGIHGDKLGLVSSYSDFARPSQNVRVQNGALGFDGMRWTWEHSYRRVPVISPLFCWMSKVAYEDLGGFAPINWYADDIACFDLSKKGYNHYVSRSYVHHVGSQTVGLDYAKLNEEALSWARVHRPDFILALLGE